MRHRRRKNRLFFYTAIAIFVLISLLLVERHIHLLASKRLSEKPTADPKTEQSSQTNTNNAANQTQTLPANAQKAVSEQKTSLKMPILMYHYIRDYTDQNDKIGINLSVSPGTFRDQLDAISKKGYTPITFQDVESGNIPQKPIILSFDDGYADFYTNAWPFLRERNYKAVSYIITGYSGSNYMTPDQIKEISDSGIEIGSHTIDHPDLSKANDQKALQEISQSKSTLESITGKKVISFCYPSGKFTDETARLVENQGYKYAATTQSGTANFASPYSLSRFRVTNETNMEKLLK